MRHVKIDRLGDTFVIRYNGTHRLQYDDAVDFLIFQLDISQSEAEGILNGL